MADTLVIVESPAKAKTIARYLGRKYTVKASMGHLRDLPKSRLGVDIEHHFEPTYITIRGKGEIVKELRDAAKKVKNVLLASDPDREGEAIAWHLTQLLKLDPTAKCRIELHEITEPGVKEALQQVRSIDGDLVGAQQGRRVLDRLVGYELSPLLWRKIQRGLSAGRVQSAAVRLICDREAEIIAFVPQEYWTVDAKLRAKGGTFVARLTAVDGERTAFTSRTQVDALLNRLDGVSFTVAEVKQGTRLRNPQPPFTTSTLQQEAARKLHFRARRTMAVAQQLYEGLELGKDGTVGLITYMRTDSTRISDVAAKEAEAYIRDSFGNSFIPDKPRRYSMAQRAQDAHEAIRPTSVMRTPEKVAPFLNKEQQRLYELIWKRFVASQMASAVYDTVTATIVAGPSEWKASGSTLRFAGYTAVYEEGEDEPSNNKEGRLPPLEKGETLGLKAFDPQQHFTEPPPRYTEARLIKALEELGIGRPSTYATIIDTIQRRGYVTLEQRRFIPTPLGEKINELLKEYFPEIVDIDFTAKVETRLDQVAEGALDWHQVVADFWEEFSQRLAVAERAIPKEPERIEWTDETCPKCGKPLAVKHGRFGDFLACSGFPDCRFTKPLLISIGIPCPQCGAPLVERQSRKGRHFYGCSNYPQCRQVFWDRPVGKRCPQCGSWIVEKKGRNGSLNWVCSNRECAQQYDTDDPKLDDLPKLEEKVAIP